MKKRTLTIILAVTAVLLMTGLLLAGIFLFGVNQNHTLNQFEVTVGEDTTTFSTQEVLDFPPPLERAEQVMLSIVNAEIDYMRISGDELTIQFTDQAQDPSPSATITIPFQLNNNIMSFAAEDKTFCTCIHWLFEDFIWRHDGRNIILRYVYPNVDGIVTEPDFVLDIIFRR